MTDKRDILELPLHLSDINRRGLERSDVRRDPGLRWRRQYRRARLRLFHYSLHMRQLYPSFTGKALR